jgi:hypothetical protein
MNAEDFLGEVRKSGFKAGMEEESVKTEALKAELAKLKQENEENEVIRRDFDDGLLVHSENVLCSYDDVGDYIWLRLKTICQDEPALQDHFDWNELIRGFKGIPELKKELAELKQENENLKVELAGDDARMDKMEKASKMKISKLLKENEKLKAQLEKKQDV